MFPGIFASPSSVLDYIMRIASCLLSNGEQVSPKKARLSDIRSLGCLFSLVSFSAEHHRQAWLVSMGDAGCRLLSLRFGG